MKEKYECFNSLWEWQKEGEKDEKNIKEDCFNSLWEWQKMKCRNAF